VVPEPYTRSIKKIMISIPIDGAAIKGFFFRWTRSNSTSRRWFQASNPRRCSSTELYSVSPSSSVKWWTIDLLRRSRTTKAVVSLPSFPAGGENKLLLLRVDRDTTAEASLLPPPGKFVGGFLLRTHRRLPEGSSGSAECTRRCRQAAGYC
jgi:hypothetical protein